jgi:predicted acetylornithine/succinylornithine family transaminase
MNTYAPNLALVRGEGAYVWDADGKKYLDFLGGIAVISVGHCHPKLVAAISGQAARLMHVSNLFFNEHQPVLAKRLVELSGMPEARVFFCNSGAEANEAFIKLARLWGHDRGKFEIVTMKNSFHGRTLAAITATGQTKYQKGFDPLPAGFSYAEFNDLASVRALVNERTVAVMVEAVQGEGGVVPATPEFLRGLRGLCDERDLLLFFDEVQCGMGRTGRWFGFQGCEVIPDGFSLAKGLAGGFPIGALVGGRKIATVFQPGNHASTFGGTPLACAAALAVLDIVDGENLCANAGRMGRLIEEELREMATDVPWISDVRGRGLMIGLVLDRPAKPLEKLLLERGLITIATADRVIRMLPPLTIQEGHVREALQILREAIGEMRE